MKKVLIALLLASIAGAAFGEMDEFAKTWSLITTNSDTASQVCRGDVEAVWVDIVALTTNTVLITDEHGTIFSKDVTADSLLPLRFPTYGSTGTALSEANSAATNAVVGKRPVNSKVTIRSAYQANTTGTNAVTIKLIFSK